MTLNRCSICNSDPLIGTERGEQAMDGWAFGYVRCPGCGDAVIEHVPPALMLAGDQGLAELKHSVSKTWNEKHKAQLKRGR